MCVHRRKIPRSRLHYWLWLNFRQIKTKSNLPHTLSSNQGWSRAEAKTRHFPILDQGRREVVNNSIYFVGLGLVSRSQLVLFERLLVHSKISNEGTLVKRLLFSNFFAELLILDVGCKQISRSVVWGFEGVRTERKVRPPKVLQTGEAWGHAPSGIGAQKCHFLRFPQGIFSK